MLFDYLPKDYEKEWVDMPEYNNVNEPDPFITATYKFRNEADYLKFKELAKKYIYNDEKMFDGQQQKDKKQAWYPLKEKSSNYRYKSKEQMNPRFPVYIVSKGRFKKNPTSKTLQEMNIPFKIIVEEQEYKDYCNLVGKDNVLILPNKYKEDYDTYWDDNDTRTGPGASRNYAWDHSIENGYEWHWVLDDNIESFERFNNNMKVKCENGFAFYLTEEFVLRYQNVGQAGFNYANFLHSHEFRPPFQYNTRIYSCILIRNNIPFRWRGRYNEDTDLSLRILKSGLCTIQMNAFLQGKMATTKMKGGNTDEFYDKEGTKKKSKMLEDMHPDVAKVTWRFNRIHHHVDYTPFKKNRLVPKDKNIYTKDIKNDFGIFLEKIK